VSKEEDRPHPRSTTTKFKKRGPIWLDRDLLRSEAFRGLSAAAIHVYFELRMRCKMQRLRTPSGRAKEWVIKNNAELIFTYAEAARRGFPPTTFARAIDQLVERGLIDIAKLGSGGRKHDATHYAISSRWEKFGTGEFEKATRPKDNREGRGFRVMWAQKREAEKANIGNKNGYPNVVRIPENGNRNKIRGRFGYPKTGDEKIGKSPERGVQ